jgi:hypothetical protein
MNEQANSVAAIASEMGRLAATATAQSNLQRQRIAAGNIRSGTAQLVREESVQRRTVARALAKHIGQTVTAQAYRGGGGRSSEQGLFAATSEAADQTAGIAGTRAANEARLMSSQQVVTEDRFLSGNQGAVQGLNIGTQIASALASQTEEEFRQSSEQLDNHSQSPTFSNTIDVVANTPGLNLSNVLGLNDGQIRLNFGI